MEDKPIIKIENLNVTYFLGKPNRVRALTNINLKIYPGELIIFFGPSGCGKSTLLYSIAGLETNTMGDIYVGGRNIARIGGRELERFHQKKIGMIFQAYYLINSLTVFKNVILPQIAIGGKAKERADNALKILEHFGVKEQKNKLPNELSGGQQQRVAICRALINNPDILLADEPVGNLDSRSAEDVMNLLKNLNKNQKKTIVLVTHNPAYINSAHRVFYMKDGAIVNVKINKAINETISTIQDNSIKASISKELELLAKTFSSITPNNMGALLIPFKAKEIVSEVFTGLTVEEISRIERKVESLLLSRNYNTEMILKFLDDNAEDGGLGLDRRVAKSLSRKIANIVDEIKALNEEEEKIDSGQTRGFSAEVEQIKNYLFSFCKIELKDNASLDACRLALVDRLKNNITGADFQRILNQPVKKGGAGLDKRKARKMKKRLELLLLGKYK